MGQRKSRKNKALNALEQSVISLLPRPVPRCVMFLLSGAHDVSRQQIQIHRSEVVRLASRAGLLTGERLRPARGPAVT